MFIFLSWCLLSWIAEGAVLDPALYLSPSPPMTSSKDTPPKWLQRMERDADLTVIPIQLKSSMPAILAIENEEATQTLPDITSRLLNAVNRKTEVTRPPCKGGVKTLPITTTPATEEQESMDKAETFWPVRTTGPYLGGIHIPLTFSLTGGYGGYGANSGVIGSSYASVSDDNGIFGLYGKYKTSLAGSGYGTYSGTRIYGGSNGASWSGWGNGKWGHYGKG